MTRFLIGLVVIDALVIVAFALPGAARGPVAATAPITARADAGVKRPAAMLWKGVDPAVLGKKTADAYLAARKRIGKNKRVMLIAPKKVGDDVEIRVKIADPKGFGFPPGTYCFHCAMQKCLFTDGAAAALQTVSEAIRPEDVRELVRVAGGEHVQVSYVGGASGGPVVPKAESQSCDGEQARTDQRVPPAFDIYAASECGARKCELSGSGETIDLGDGFIDDNKKLACLRAMCLSAAAGGMADLPVRFMGDLSFEQGQAYRGAEVALTLRGVAGADNRDGYGAFWSTLTAALEEPK